ncbi:helix-turn-helix domain-containing protein [Dyadobacter subterraneus]|uniref:Helix-turn-helix transcriptional regulator n=1 Tax=Dyadobacter subterraneus TaxID=2773304 RepID=A0ABR9WE29_9BACT|nr:AraC family transcriptional regulator [Dyadobacter subterraneus]MBE9463682.1 helix-turn-helix transcriptional regulator [Dyadobacter subterraneus]
MNEVQHEMLRLATRLGVPVLADDAALKLLQFDEMKVVDMLPDMLVLIRSLVATETFFFKRKPMQIEEKGLLISFQNMFNTAAKEAIPAARPPACQPHVRITPSNWESEVTFPKDFNIRQITILLSLNYLRNFIGKDQSRLEYLFNADQTLWIEEFMSPQMAKLVNEISDSHTDPILPEAYYRLKSLELIYLLFENLLNRQDIRHRSLSNYEIEAVYLVRNALEDSLDSSFTMAGLVKVSGMNELKLRKIFTQVFGMGLNDYHQHRRMQEAARLLREEKRSVSEVGYQLGFSNLSYFGRLFEKYFGLKPKKWSEKNRI